MRGNGFFGVVMAGWLVGTSCAFADEIKIGNTAPYSGPGSSFSMFAKVENAYFKYLNDKGGINGRKINFISYDDAYSPPKTVEQTRRLVENDDVLLMFASIGTSHNLSVRKYLNDRKVPQLFAITGSIKLADPKNFPWTMPFGSTQFQAETAVYAKYLKDNLPDAKVGVIYQNDDYGKDYLNGLRDALGKDAERFIVAAESYDAKEPSIDSQLARLKAAGITVLADFTTTRFSALVLRRMGEMNWRPLHMLGNITANINVVLKPAGLENSKGMLTAAAFKDPSDPRWKDDPGFLKYVAFMKKWYPEGDPNDYVAAMGYSSAQLLEKTLERCGNEFSRENIMKQAASLKNVELDMMLPGITINTSETTYFPFQKMQLLRFNGQGWDSVGEPVAESQ